MLHIGEGAPIRLYQNKCPPFPTYNYFVVKPRAADTNRFSIGATIRLNAGSLSMTRVITAGTSFLGQEPCSAGKPGSDQSSPKRAPFTPRCSWNATNLVIRIRPGRCWTSRWPYPRSWACDRSWSGCNPRGKHCVRKQRIHLPLVPFRQIHLALASHQTSHLRYK